MDFKRYRFLKRLTWSLCTLGALASPTFAAQTPAPAAPQVSPCEDFFEYACGDWIKANPIPADQGRWGQFMLLRDRNISSLETILKSLASHADQATDAGDRQLGHFYRACMDEETVKARGLAPLQAEFDRIAKLKSKKELPALLGHLQTIGVYAPIALSAQPDLKDSGRMIAWLSQSGLGLPERDYYLKDDAASLELKAKYQAHIAEMFIALEPKAEGVRAQIAKVIVQMENLLAKASQSKVALREPSNMDHKMAIKQLTQSAPGFDWQSFFTAAGASRIENLNVESPDFVKEVAAMVKSVSLNDWKTYLQWHLLSTYAPLLDDSLVKKNFDFYGRTLAGIKELKPRYKRCIAMTDGDLGELLGQKYVDKHFAGDAKPRMVKMVENLERNFEALIQKLPWMGDATKRKATEKLHAIANKLGYPDKIRDYSAIKVLADDLAGNHLRAQQFAYQIDIAKIGKAVDKSEWGATAPTVNAFYNPQLNDITFPAGILQPPYFDLKGDSAANYGAIGAVIGHELTHGFDDEGRHFDATGNLNDWWAESDSAAFESRASCLVDQYSSYTAIDDTKVNGKLTLGENIADHGGVKLSYAAMKSALSEQERASIGGRTPAQRFFLGYARVWCENKTPQSAKLQAKTDPHSPGRFRVNGVLSNTPEFAEAFACKSGQAMVKKPVCTVW